MSKYFISIDLKDLNLLKHRSECNRNVINNRIYDYSREEKLAKFIVNQAPWKEYYLLRYEYDIFYDGSSYKGDLAFYDFINDIIYCMELKTACSTTYKDKKSMKCINQSFIYANVSKSWCGKVGIPVCVTDDGTNVTVDILHRTIYFKNENLFKELPYDTSVKFTSNESRTEYEFIKYIDNNMSKKKINTILTYISRFLKESGAYKQAVFKILNKNNKMHYKTVIVNKNFIEKTNLDENNLNSDMMVMDMNMDANTYVYANIDVGSNINKDVNKDIITESNSISNNIKDLRYKEINEYKEINDSDDVEESDEVDEVDEIDKVNEIDEIDEIDEVDEIDESNYSDKLDELGDILTVYTEEDIDFFEI